MNKPNLMHSIDALIHNTFTPCDKCSNQTFELLCPTCISSYRTHIQSAMRTMAITNNPIDIPHTVTTY